MGAPGPLVGNSDSADLPSVSPEAASAVSELEQLFNRTETVNIGTAREENIVTRKIQFGQQNLGGGKFALHGPGASRINEIAERFGTTGLEALSQFRADLTPGTNTTIRLRNLLSPGDQARADRKSPQVSTKVSTVEEANRAAGVGGQRAASKTSVAPTSQRRRGATKQRTLISLDDESKSTILGG